MCLAFFVSYTSAIFIRMAVSSTPPKEALIAVPNVFMEGDKLMYAFTSGGMFSPSIRT